MTTVLVTGAKGFIGKNLCLALKRDPDISLFEYDVDSEISILEDAVGKAVVIFHLAGINRPEKVEDFEVGNHGFTITLLDLIKKSGNKPVIAITSSTQALLDNPYGASKRLAENEICAFGQESGAPVYIYRLANVFGKWCRPFYNSVIATFCHQAAHNQPLRVDDPTKEIDFIYIDDIVRELSSLLQKDHKTVPDKLYSIQPVYKKSLGDISKLLDRFSKVKFGEPLPDFSDEFQKKLYSTYLSYLEKSSLVYSADKKSDNRGYLYELLKTDTAGQIFVSRTLSGITRGNHYHDSKVEKFCVVDGSARISFRSMISGEIFFFDVEGTECKVVDIPPGFTHNIKNTGTHDLLTLFWVNEVFNADKPDTYFSEV